MSSEDYLGIGEALVVREKCESIKLITAKTTFKNSNNFTIINYENSIIGKQVLSGLTDNFSAIASNTSLVFRFQKFEFLGILFLVTEITGDYKKCNYSSLDIQLHIPSATNKALYDNLKSKAKGADEFHKLLESNASLNKLFLKLKEKHNI
jgi:hypothetical protein